MMTPPCPICGAPRTKDANCRLKKTCGRRACFSVLRHHALARRHTKRTHCQYGHAFDAANTIGTKSRQCRTCLNDRYAWRYARDKSGSPSFPSFAEWRTSQPARRQRSTPKRIVADRPWMGLAAYTEQGLPDLPPPRREGEFPIQDTPTDPMSFSNC